MLSFFADIDIGSFSNLGGTVASIGLFLYYMRDEGQRQQRREESFQKQMETLHVSTMESVKDISIAFATTIKQMHDDAREIMKESTASTRECIAQLTQLRLAIQAMHEDLDQIRLTIPEPSGVRRRPPPPAPPTVKE